MNTARQCRRSRSDVKRALPSRLRRKCFVRLLAGRMISPPEPARWKGGWIRQLGPRVRTCWMAKMAGTTLGMTGFFLAYFWLLHHPVFPVTVMPLTALDRMIAFRPETLGLYVSLWIYVSLAPALVIDRRELWSYGVAALAMSVVGLGIFYRWPTTVPVLNLDWSQHGAFSMLKEVDAAGNACPSLHVAFAVFTGVWFERLLRGMGAGWPVRLFNAAWCVGIIYSTMAIRQHVALDVYAGTLLGGAIVALQFWFLGRGASPEPDSCR